MSSLQKLIILNVINQRWDKMKAHILPSQAAYQRRIPTIAQVLAIEFVIEKSINIRKLCFFFYKFKAFDALNRPKLINILYTLSERENHMMHLIINVVILCVPTEEKTDVAIIITLRICQSDRSALHFVFQFQHITHPWTNSRF